MVSLIVGLSNPEPQTVMDAPTQEYWLAKFCSWESITEGVLLRAKGKGRGSVSFFSLPSLSECSNVFHPPGGMTHEWGEAFPLTMTLGLEED